MEKKDIPGVLTLKKLPYNTQASQEVRLEQREGNNVAVSELTASLMSEDNEKRSPLHLQLINRTKVKKHKAAASEGLQIHSTT